MMSLVSEVVIIFKPLPFCPSCARIKLAVEFVDGTTRLDMMKKGDALRVQVCVPGCMCACVCVPVCVCMCVRVC